MKGSLTEKKGEFALAKQQLSREKIKPLEDYVTSCLEVATRTALEILGKQGGRLYVSQGGPIPDFTRDQFGKEYLEYEDFKVAYAIFPPKGTIANYLFSETPEYPFIGFPEVRNLTSGDLIHSIDDPFMFAYFGRNRLPELQKPFRNSIESQLESFVINNTIACLDWTTFELQNLQIGVGTPTINVTLGKKDVYFEFHYPLKIKEKTSRAEYQLKDFTVKYPLRLIDIFDFIEFITDRDTTDLDFKITEARKDGMRADILENVRENDDIYLIRDPQSKIIDKPFEFRFAAHNRPPALFSINNSRDGDAITDFVICGVWTPDEYFPPSITLADNTLTIENPALCPDDLSTDTLVLPLHAVDPDDENVTLTFSTGFNQEPITSLEIDEQTIRFLEKNFNIDADPKYFSLTVKASDNVFADTEQLQFRTHLEPILPG